MRLFGKYFGFKTNDNVDDEVNKEERVGYLTERYTGPLIYHFLTLECRNIVHLCMWISISAHTTWSCCRFLSQAVAPRAMTVAVIISHSPKGVFLIYMALWCCFLLLAECIAAARRIAGTWVKVIKTTGRLVFPRLHSLIAAFCPIRKSLFW